MKRFLVPRNSWDHLSKQQRCAAAADVTDVTVDIPLGGSPGRPALKTIENRASVFAHGSSAFTPFHLGCPAPPPMHTSSLANTPTAAVTADDTVMLLSLFDPPEPVSGDELEAVFYPTTSLWNDPKITAAIPWVESDWATQLSSQIHTLHTKYPFMVIKVGQCYERRFDARTTYGPQYSSKHFSRQNRFMLMKGIPTTRHGINAENLGMRVASELSICLNHNMIGTTQACYTEDDPGCIYAVASLHGSLAEHKEKHVSWHVERHDPFWERKQQDTTTRKPYSYCGKNAVSVAWDNARAFPILEQLLNKKGTGPTSPSSSVANAARHAAVVVDGLIDAIGYDQARIKLLAIKTGKHLSALSDASFPCQKYTNGADNKAMRAALAVQIAESF